MNRLFRGEVVEQIGFRKARDFGDLVKCRTPEAVLRKHVEGGLHDGFGIAPLDARARPVRRLVGCLIGRLIGRLAFVHR